MTEQMKGHLAFGGFNASFHMDAVARMLGIYGDDLPNADSPWTTKDLVQYAKYVVAYYNTQVKTKLEFVELYSPADYSFVTDTIIVKFTEDDITAIKQYISDNDYGNAVMEEMIGWVTPSSGFAPFYPTLADLRANRPAYFEALSASLHHVACQSDIDALSEVTMSYSISEARSL